MVRLKKVLADTTITSVPTTGTVAQAKTQRVNPEQHNRLEKDKGDFITALQKVGSVGLARMRKKGASISAKVAFKKDDFPANIQDTEFVNYLIKSPENNNFKVRGWGSDFYRHVDVEIYTKSNEYRRFMEFCDNQCDTLNEKTNNANGRWKVIIKKENQILRFAANKGVILSEEAEHLDWEQLSKFLGQQAENNQNKKKAENWLSIAVPMFEKEFFRMCEEYIETVGDEI